MSADLEDIYELIEFLPQDLKDRFTNLRELDLSVENNVDRAKMLEKVFFAKAQKMSQNDRKASNEEIMKHYNKAIEDADEKVEIATSAQDLLERLIRVLSTQIDDKKRSMEKENPGCTEAIERSVEAQQPSTSSSQKENRYTLNSSRPQQNRPDSKQSKSRQKSKHLSRKEKKRRDSNASSTSVDKRILATSSNMSLPEPRQASVNSGPIVAQQQSSASSGLVSASSSVGQVNSVVPVNTNLAQRAGHIGLGGNAIAAAASQAIAATQQMQQGRRTASLKASYEAINTGGVHATEFSRELQGAAQTAIAAIQEKKHKKKVSSASASSTNLVPASVQQQQVQQQAQHQQQLVAAASIVTVPSTASQVGSISHPFNSAAAVAVTQTHAAVDAENPEWTYDPNEPRYCICNQISYGEMVACDNTDCPYEWFHYPCVNITASPKGKWYCPQCTTVMKRRGGRKN